MKPESKHFWELEVKLQDIAQRRGWTIREMLDIHRNELDFLTYSEITRILKVQAELIKKIYPELVNVIPFNFRGQYGKLWERWRWKPY